MVKYFTPEEIAIHNCAEDCWVSIYDNVYDITSLVLANPGELIQPLLKNAGLSISHWFNEKTKDVKTYIDPVKNIPMPYLPEGRYLHVPPEAPTPWSTSQYENPWWKDEQYMIGKLTSKKRLIKIVNMLTKTEDTIYVCDEETIDDIRDRYLEYNAHSKSYTWKKIVGDAFVPLLMDSTLEGNGLADESEEFFKLGIDEDLYLTTLHIYYNDDLTVM